MMKGGINVKTVVVLIILVLVGVLGVLCVTTVKTYIVGATSGNEPKNVLSTPSDDGKSAVITWVSENPTIGVVEYGTTPASLLLRALETDTISDHKISLTPLKPGTKYYFRIRIGDDIFDDNGIPFAFKTNELASSNDMTYSEKITPVPMVSVVPTASSTSVVKNNCDRTTDYNNDGAVNSLDYITCIKLDLRTGDSAGTSQLSATSSVSISPIPSTSSASMTDCNKKTDYDNNGVINSLDRLKCLQNTRQ